MGARIAISRRYSRTEYEESQDASIKKCNTDRLTVSLGASVSSETASCDEVSINANSEEIEGFSREYVTTYGSAAAKDLTAWSQQEFTSPLPIKMKLSPILNLFTSSHMNRYDVKYKKVLRWIAPLYQSYCENQKKDLGIPSCHPKNQKGCGWNDDCIPRIQHCLNRDTDPSGYYCCTLKCRDLPCHNGGTCSDVKDSCGFTCKCKKPYLGDTCTDKSIYKSILEQEVKQQMAKDTGKSNDKFRITLYNFLSSEYPRYWFTVNSYNPVSDPKEHAVSGAGCVKIFKQYGRNVVACWARKDIAAPSRAKQQEIFNGVLKAITKKKRDANDSLELAIKKAKTYGQAYTLIMVVRFGNGLRTKFPSTRTLFANFVCERKCRVIKCVNHESSLVMMFGKP